MPWFRRPPKDPDAVERMKSEIANLRDAIEAHDERRRAAAAAAAAEHPADERDERDERIDTLAAELAALRDGRDERVEALAAEVAALRDAPPAPDPAERLEGFAAQLAELDARVTSVSTELTNQLTELSGDIDALAGLPSNQGGVDSQTLTDLREGQARLANEQARYQISFREDLARLVEELRRPGRP